MILDTLFRNIANKYLLDYINSELNDLIKTENKIHSYLDIKIKKIEERLESLKIKRMEQVTYFEFINNDEYSDVNLFIINNEIKSKLITSEGDENEGTLRSKVTPIRIFINE
jgi:hypothetical protein